MTMTHAPGGTWSQWPAKVVTLKWTDDAGNANSFTFDLVVSETWNEDASVTEHPVELGTDVADHVRVQLRTCELKVWATNEPIDANQYTVMTPKAVALDLPSPEWTAQPGTLFVPSWDNPIALRSLASTLVGVAGNIAGAATHSGQIVGDIAALVGVEAADLLIPATPGVDVVSTDAGLEPVAVQGITAHVQSWGNAAQQVAGVDFVQKTIAQLLLLKNTVMALTIVGTKCVCDPMVIEKLSYTRSSDTGTGADITIGFKEVRTVASRVVPAPIPNLSAGGGLPPQNKGKQQPTSPAPNSKSYALYFKNLFSQPGGIAGAFGIGQ
jgi:hypothetical protein